MFGIPEDMAEMLGAFMDRDAGVFASAARGPRARTTARTLSVSLADLYNGKTMNISRVQTVPCSTCDGRGSKRKKSASCPYCRGSGSRSIVRQMGMMMQHVKVPCDGCGGAGNIIDPKDLCTSCGGAKTMQAESPLTVVIRRGMQDKEEIHFPSKGDFQPDTGLFNDIVIVLEQERDDVFERDGEDLVMTCVISLAESLCGFQRAFKHLDGRELVMRRAKGEITQPGEVKVIIGEGMPAEENPTLRGDLLIKFEVAFPERVEQSQIDLLRQSLPPPKSVDTQHCEDASECYASREELDRLRKELVEDEEDTEDSAGFECTHQ